MDIPHAIKDLLTKREGLVVPGLGSFISEYKPASIEQDKKLIQPPRKQLRFDPNVREDADEVLAKELSSRGKVTMEQAHEKLRKYVEEIHNRLNTQGVYKIEGIGALEKKPDGSIGLVQDGTPEADLGFEPLEAEPFELETPSPPPKTKTPGPSHTPKPPQAPPRPPARKRPLRKRTIWLTVLALFLLLIGYAGWYTGFYDYVIYKWQQRQQTAQMEQKKHDKEKQKSAAQKTKQKAAEPTTTDTTGKITGVDQVLDKMTDKKQALMYKEQKDTKTYYIVAGSFKKMKNAREFCGQLEEKGYKANILEKNGLYRITIQAFDKKEDALVKLYQMRDTGKLESIWLLAVQEKDR